MGKQRLEELDKLVEELLIFTNIDVNSGHSCNKFIKEHNLNQTEEDYVYFRLRSKAANVLNVHVDILEATIMKGEYT